ncbi:MAG: hypothetical protein J6X18_09085 [Bacteroidales bacterium]|nr:hypothetical protein [Bacteroidales bacterium]
MDWISNISDSVIATLENSRMPMQSPPAMPLFCESQIRPGLSATTLASKIISRLPDIGIPTGPNPDGTENIVNKFVRIISEEVVNAIKDDAVVMSSIPMGYIPVTGTGGNAGGPVQIVGFNSAPTVIKGVMQ